MNRRAFLSASAAAALSGCSTGEPREASETDATESRESSDATESTPRWIPEVPLDGWEMGRGGPRRAGRAPNAELSLSDAPSVRWEIAVPQRSLDGIAATAYGVFTGRTESDTTVVFRRNPTKNHSVTSGGARKSEPAVRDGTMYYGSEAGVYAVDARDDRTEWTAEVGGMPMEDENLAVPVNGTPAVSDDTVYAIALSDHGGPTPLLAFDSTDGSRRWTHELVDEPHDIVEESLLVDDVVVTAVPDADAAELLVSAVDRETGEAEWKTAFSPSEAFDFSRPTRVSPTATDARVLVAARSSVRAFDRASGERKWTYVLGNDSFAASVATDERNAYVSTESGRVLAIDHRSGELTWSTSVSGYCTRPVAVGDDDVVAVSQRPDGRGKGLYDPATVTTIEKKRGSVRWTFEHDGSATAPVIGKGTIFVGFQTVRNGAFSTICSLG